MELLTGNMCSERSQKIGLMLRMEWGYIVTLKCQGFSCMEMSGVIRHLIIYRKLQRTVTKVTRQIADRNDVRLLYIFYFYT